MLNKNENFTLFNCFPVETSKVGYDDLDTYVFYEGKTQKSKQEQTYRGQFDVTFTPGQPGQYMVSVYCGGVEIPGTLIDSNVLNLNSEARHNYAEWTYESFLLI